MDEEQRLEIGEILEPIKNMTIIINDNLDMKIIHFKLEGTLVILKYLI